MSYVVLARKYRPRSFAQMVGQEHVVRALANALAQQRLHHAYLFTGTRGIGKTTVSRILAKCLNCTGADGRGGITAEPCGVCSACVEIDEDRYIDYIELDAASNRGIDEARELIDRAAYKPGIGRFKVFMIDEAHQLTKDAFSALLKTLEEPPEYLKFVLATTDPEKMLPTVLSRCLQFNLRPMAPQVVAAHLEHILRSEAVAHDAAALRLLARAARGSMRDALSLADQAIAYGGGRFDEAGVRAMLGSVDGTHVAALVEAVAQRDGPALLRRVELLRGLGLSAEGTLESMALLLQHMAVEQAVPGALDAEDPDHEDPRRLAPLLPPDETQLLYSIVLQGRGELALMADEYAALTMVLLRMLAFAPAAEAAAPAASPPTAVPAAAAAQGDAASSSALPSSAPLGGHRAQRTAAAASPAAAPAAPAVCEPAPPRGAAASAPAAAQPPMPSAKAHAQPVLGEPPPWVEENPPDDAAAPPASAALRAASAPALAVPAAARPPDAPAALVPTALGGQWRALVERLAAAGAIAALVRELAWQAGLETVDDTAQPPCWQLRVERESLRTDALRDKLAAALQAELGHPVRLLLLAGAPGDSPARRDAAERAARQRRAEQTIRDDPLVQALMAQFKTARIVPGSIKPL
ncbi:MAG TPA: DNA polymerase III subunit gamma/tau [Rubrivivax sp.]|nr:DNA polymerase III subunit gamma/tau [Rubrivivax sp.]